MYMTVIGKQQNQSCTWLQHNYVNCCNALGYNMLVLQWNLSMVVTHGPKYLRDGRNKLDPCIAAI